MYTLNNNIKCKPLSIIANKGSNMEIKLKIEGHKGFFFVYYINKSNLTLTKYQYKLWRLCL